MKLEIIHVFSSKFANYVVGEMIRSDGSDELIFQMGSFISLPSLGPRTNSSSMKKPPSFLVFIPSKWWKTIQPATSHHLVVSCRELNCETLNFETFLSGRFFFGNFLAQCVPFWDPWDEFCIFTYIDFG